MIRLVLANQATAGRRRVYFHLVGTDGITPATGEAAGQPQISSDGAAWTNTGIGTLSAIGNGRYSADLTQAAVLTTGTSIETRYKSGATAECPGDSVRVVAFDLDNAASLGLTNLDAAISSRAAAGTSVTVSSPTATDSTLTVVRGDDYFSADSRSIDFTFTSAPVLTASTVKLSFRRDDRTTSDLTVTGSVLSATQLRFEPTAINTALLTPNVPYHYDVQATLASGHVCTLVRAVAVVQQDYTP